MSDSSSLVEASGACRRPRATVIGCGVIGLTVGVMLQKHGLQCTIRARSTPHMKDELYASDKAGAHWFSFASSSDTRQQALDEMTFHALMGLAVSEPSSGVSIVRGHALFELDSTDAHSDLPWWRDLTPRFRAWTTEQLRARADETGVEYARGFSYETAMIDAPKYLRFLHARFLAAGGEIIVDQLTHLSDAWSASRVASDADAPELVVNCCGLGAATLGGVLDTTCLPDRGQTVLVRAPTITDIWRAPGAQATYILPRGDGIVVLGGTHEAGSATTPDPATASSILARCARLLPLLRDPSQFTVLDHSVGLRPSRTSAQPPRIEVDSSWSDGAGGGDSAAVVGRDRRGPLVVHAYGHSGAGFQSSWGTAALVVQIARNARPTLFQHTDATPPRKQMYTGVVQRAAGEREPAGGVRARL